jgi:fumarate reductase subunit D
MKEKVDDNGFAMPKKNILYIIAGFVVMLVGYALMAGGGSDDPNVFNEEMFSFRRIVLAPIVIIAGIIVEIWAIMHVGKSKGENN